MNTETSLRRRRDRSPLGFEDLKRFRVLLLALRRELSRSFEELSEAARRAIGESLADPVSGVGDPSTAFAFLARAEAEMIEIEDALERIDYRSFGLCEVCDQPIPQERLQAVPMARLCGSCRRADEP